MNFIGIDVTGIDVHRVQEIVRAFYLAAYLFWVASVWTKKRRLALWGPVLLALTCWFMATFPLQGLYGLGLGTDRMRHLWWSASVAAGQPAWDSGILDRKSLEPAWSLFVSVLALRDPGRVFTVYAFLPALAIALTGVGLVVSLRNVTLGDSLEGSPSDERYHAALWVCFFVLLASTGPIDYLNPYRGFWAKNFMLKPNHALGFALIPLCVAIVSKERDWRRSATAVVLFGLLGWVFITHWALLCWGVFLYATVTSLSKRTALSESIRLMAILLGGLLVVTPYLYYLIYYFPQTVNFDPSPFVEEPLRSIWGESPPRAHSLFFLVTLDLGVNFYLAIYGLWASWRRGTKFERIWSSVVVSSYLAWLINVVLLFKGQARQSDEIYFFLVFAVAVQAGLGAYRLSERASRFIATRGAPLLRSFKEPSKMAALGLLLCLPLTVGWWWDPMRMDAHFRLGLVPLPRPVVEIGQWVRENTRPSDVLLAGAETALWIPAVSGRRILFADDLNVVRSAIERRVLNYAVLEPDAPVPDETEPPGVRESLVDLLTESGTIQKVFAVGSVDVYSIRYE